MSDPYKEPHSRHIVKDKENNRFFIIKKYKVYLVTYHTFFE